MNRPSQVTGASHFNQSFRETRVSFQDNRKTIDIDPLFRGLFSSLTEKGDVYSFGVVLAELLTRNKTPSFCRSVVERNLAMYFVSSMKKDLLLHILINIFF
ncbi:tyrosine kinase [Medicago truncatula]|uniref:Tyrosine kinase n=1 Tax=Medicago truncatula TaxID=3880 RepID=G7JTK5_MEDTR|nr:tyrosine kinase [Medicago truncatula]